MLTDDATGIFARCAGLGAEARSVGRERDWQAGFVEDLVAIEVCDGDLGGGDEPVVAVFEFAAGDGFGVGVGAAEEIVGEFGKLARAEERLAVHHEGWKDFSVAVIRGVEVEHEADERTFEPSTRAHVDGEARTGELRGSLEIEDAESLADLPVRLGGEVPCAVRSFGQMGLHDDVVFFGFAGGDFVAGEVGDAGEGEAKLVVEAGSSLVEFFEIFFKLASFFLEGGGLFLVAGLH